MMKITVDPGDTGLTKEQCDKIAEAVREGKFIIGHRVEVDGKTMHPVPKPEDFDQEGV